MMDSAADFDRWVNDPSSPMAQELVNLLKLGRTIEAAFGEKRKIELLKQAIVMLIESGKRLIFRDAGTEIWEWTDRLYVTPDGEKFETPDIAAEVAVMRWQYFGDGEVEQFWFGKRLPGAS